MNRKEIISFAVLKCAKIAGTIMAVSTALFFWPILLLSLLIPSFSAAPRHPNSAPPLILFAVFPLLEGIAAFLMTALTCWLYNVLSARIGGIEIELGDPRTASTQSAAP